jgi:hypothetical protein
MTVGERIRGELSKLETYQIADTPFCLSRLDAGEWCLRCCDQKRLVSCRVWLSPLALADAVNAMWGSLTDDERTAVRDAIARDKQMDAKKYPNVAKVVCAMFETADNTTGSK